MSDSVYQTLLDTHQLHPNWFQEKSKAYSWESPNFKDKFVSKLIEKLKTTDNKDLLILKLIALLLNILLPPFFYSEQFIKMVKFIHQSEQQSQKDQTFSILLVDAENLALDEKIEFVLDKICTSPITLKLAVGNWRNLGKKDEEFQGRGYELIHVTQGKNSADLKMIYLGTSLFFDSPLVREVFICSNDKDLDVLTPKLLEKGLRVYRVSRQGDTLNILDCQTQQTQNHSLASLGDIMSLDKCLERLKNIIQEEQQKNQIYWVSLVKISQIFKRQYSLSISQILAHYLPGKTVKDLFLENPQLFVIHRSSEKSPFYVTLFQTNTSVNSKASLSQTETIISTVDAQEVLVKSSQSQEINSEFNSQEALEASLIKIIEDLSKTSQKEYIPISNVATKFNQQYKKPITQVIGNFQTSKNFSDFLKSCSQFQLKQHKNNYSVCLNLKKSSQLEGMTYQFNSQEALEFSLVKIIENLSKTSQQEYIPLSIVGSEFHKQYKIPLNQVISNFKKSKKMSDFMKSCHQVKLKQDKNTYYVCLNQDAVTS